MRQSPIPEDARTAHFAAPIGLTALAVAAVTVALYAQQLPSPLSVGAQQTVTIDVGDIWFCDQSFAGAICETTISVGDTVAWDFSGAGLTHTTTACGASCVSPTVPGLWDSGWVPGGSTSPFEYTFDEPGTFLYYCAIHLTAQQGRIIVAQQEPEPTVTDTDTPTPTPTLTSTPDATAAATSTATRTPTATQAATSTVTRTVSPTTTGTATATLAATSTPSRTPTPIPSPTVAATPTIPPGATAPPGDVNCDGITDPVDAALILQLSARLITGLQCPASGDLNGDGTISAIDATLVLHFAAGLLNGLPP